MVFSFDRQYKISFILVELLIEWKKVLNTITITNVQFKNIFFSKLINNNKHRHV